MRRCVELLVASLVDKFYFRVKVVAGVGAGFGSDGMAWGYREWWSLRECCGKTGGRVGGVAWRGGCLCDGGTGAERVLGLTILVGNYPNLTFDFDCPSWNPTPQ